MVERYKENTKKKKHALSGTTIYTDQTHYTQCKAIGNKNFVSINKFLIPFFKLFAW